MPYPSEAIHAATTIIKVGDGAGSEAFTTIAEVMNIDITFSADELDVTSHDSQDRWREYLQGLKSMEISIEGNYLPTDPTHDITSGTGQLWLFDQGTRRNYQIIFPETSQFSFTAIVREVSHGAPVDDKLAFSATLRVTGEPTLS